MKKNTMMRLASVLLIAVLMSTCAISGTFAKYVTSDSETDSALVAKWGVDFTVGSSWFEKTYNKDASDYADMALSVKAGQDVVAPGTKGTAYTFLAAADKPEVSYRVTFKNSTDVTAKTIFLASGSDKYYPVQFELTFNGSDVDLADGSIETIINAIEKLTYFYDVEDDKYYVSVDGGTTWGAAQDGAPALTLTWEWKFEEDEATNVKDTALGDLAAGETVAGYVTEGTDYNLEIAFKIVATATQIN